MDLKTAREIIGVSEDFTPEELKEKYYALTEERLPRDELTKIHDAYNTLSEHLEAQQPDIPFKEKLNNFVYHHKWHLFIGALFVTIFGLLLYSIIGAQIEKAREARLPTPAIEVMFFGEYYEAADLEPIEERIYDMFPEWERIKTQLTYAPGDAKSEFDFAALQKSIAILATERPDIYIFDRDQFEKFRNQSVFVSLDSLKKTMPETEDLWFEFTSEATGEKAIYAVDLTGHQLFQDTEIAGHEYIFAIREGAEQEENSIEFLMELLKDFE